MDTAALLAAPIPQTRGEAAAFHVQIHSAAKSLFSKGDAMTAEDVGTFDKLVAKGDEVKALITKFPAASAMKARLDGHEDFISTPVHPAGHPQGQQHGKFAVKGFQDAGETVLDRDRNVISETGAAIFGAKAWDAMQDPTYTKAFFKEYIRKGERMSDAAYKALESGLDDQGGYFAPPEMLQRIVQRKPSPTRIGGMVDTVTCGRDSVVMPKVNYTGSSTDDPNGYIYTTGFRATWTDELPANDDVANTSQANLVGQIKIPVHTCMIEGYLSVQNAEDAAYDVQGFAEGKFNETMDLLKDQMILLGNGIQQPTGLVATLLAGGPSGDAIPYVTTAGVGSIAGDDLINVSCDLPEQYDEASTWAFNKTSTYKAIRKLKDGQSRYLFGAGVDDSGLSNGRPKNLAGYPFAWSQFMPNIASNAFPAVFGDWKGYTFVNRIGFSIQVLREIAARKGLIVLLGRARFGGQTVEPWRFRGLKVQ